jgi:hypothetical protein
MRARFSCSAAEASSIASSRTDEALLGFSSEPQPAIRLKVIANSIEIIFARIAVQLSEERAPQTKALLGFGKHLPGRPQLGSRHESAKKI